MTELISSKVAVVRYLHVEVIFILIPHTTLMNYPLNIPLAAHRLEKE